jgi:hypothetical protein
MNINIKKSMCLRIGQRFNANVCNMVIDSKPVPWVQEIRYLGLYIIAARSFKCNLHCAKTKFFRSLNGILGKVGTTAPVGLTLSLISSNCNPILLYGLESIRLTKSQTQSLNYPFNSAFVKLFSTFDAKVILQCQYYSCWLPFEYVLDTRCLKFYSRLSRLDYSPASIMYAWFGASEQKVISDKYGISVTDTMDAVDNKVWSTFERSINSS